MQNLVDVVLCIKLAIDNFEFACTFFKTWISCLIFGIKGLKFYTNVHYTFTEGTVSQIIYLGPSVFFYEMRKNMFGY